MDDAASLVGHGDQQQSAALSRSAEQLQKDAGALIRYRQGLLSKFLTYPGRHQPGAIACHIGIDLRPGARVDKALAD